MWAHCFIATRHWYCQKKWHHLQIISEGQPFYRVFLHKSIVDSIRWFAQLTTLFLHRNSAGRLLPRGSRAENPKAKSPASRRVEKKAGEGWISFCVFHSFLWEKTNKQSFYPLYKLSLQDRSPFAKGCGSTSLRLYLGCTFLRKSHMVTHCQMLTPNEHHKETLQSSQQPKYNKSLSN